MRSRSGSHPFRTYDWWSVLIYTLLIGFGLVNIHSAGYSGLPFMALSQKSTMQFIWICLSLISAGFILFTNKETYYKYAALFYIATIIILISVIFFGKEVNGSKSWLGVGSFGIQPAEFGKIATALILARIMSDYDFNINTLKNKLKVAAIIITPVLIIILQNETGSALIYLSLFIVLYFEGLNRWYYITSLLLVLFFILSMLLTPTTLFFITLLPIMIFEWFNNGNIPHKIIYLSSLLSIWSLLLIGNFWYEWGYDPFNLLIFSFLLSMGLVLLYAFKIDKKVILYAAMAWITVTYTQLIDFIFDNLLQLHQQKRVLDLLGIESDLKGWGYNVNQSKIAIGSGGFWGKGYMNGTQTKFNFVPEQSTDFIFCTIGEEFGFIGTIFVIGLFSLLIYRLIRMASRVNDNFARIYTIAAVIILTMHIFINIGMTIGLAPIIGIPLPFFSYGGSSLLAFTILLFIAIRTCAETRDDLTNRL